jgi:hypothetical protein
MENKVKFPALSFAEYERNARLYQYLTSLGLYTNPCFAGDSDNIEYIIVTAAMISDSIEKRTNNTATSCVSTPMDSSKIIKNSSSSQNFRDNVVDFPTKT